MKNSLGRNVIEGFKPFVSSNEYKNHNRILANQKSINNKIEFLDSISKAFDVLNIKENMTISFHHHLRNGDYVMNMVSEEILKRDIKNLHYAPSSIFPNNANNSCKCKTRRLEADNHHIGCNTALSVFLVLYRPRYTNTGRSFA